MSQLLQIVKSLGLAEFYFSLSISDKLDMAKYSKYLTCRPEKMMSCSPDCDGCFLVANGAQFLWATAANAIPHKKHGFAERILTHALTIATEMDDRAWTHANLAQIYYDRHKLDPEAGEKSINHCRELIKIGYMKKWAQNIMEELTIFQA